MALGIYAEYKSYVIVYSGTEANSLLPTTPCRFSFPAFLVYLIHFVWRKNWVIMKYSCADTQDRSTLLIDPITSRFVLYFLLQDRKTWCLTEVVKAILSSSMEVRGIGKDNFQALLLRLWQFFSCFLCERICNACVYSSAVIHFLHSGMSCSWRK